MLSYSGITVLSFANKKVKVQPRQFVHSLYGVPRTLITLYNINKLDARWPEIAYTNISIFIQNVTRFINPYYISNMYRDSSVNILKNTHVWPIRVKMEHVSNKTQLTQL